MLLINSNTIDGGVSEMGVNGIQLTIGHLSDAFFSVGASGQANNISNVKGIGISCGKFGNNSGGGTNATKCIVAFNTINANNTSNSPGISLGAFPSGDAQDMIRLWKPPLERLALRCGGVVLARRASEGRLAGASG